MTLRQPRLFQSTLPARGATTLRLIRAFPRRFQSTLPARGATVHARCLQEDLYFNPRSPHGERREQLLAAVSFCAISIHAPRTGSDCVWVGNGSGWRAFQSTLPARGATGGIQHFVPAIAISIHAPRTGSDGDLLSRRLFLFTISIHAPRTGSDRPLRWRWASAPYFNPRSPHGERRERAAAPTEKQRFQSTLPARGATFAPVVLDATDRFQSTLPARGATSAVDFKAVRLHISIHAPRTGSDPGSPAERRNDYISIHAPRTGSDARRTRNAYQQDNFNPRSPHGERRQGNRLLGGTHRFQSTLPARGATASTAPPA